jgi:CRISPR-associated protein Cas1
VASAGETPKSIHAVQGFIRGKLKNYRTMLLRAQREGITGLESGITRLEQAIQPINQTSIIDALRGLEGAGSAAYFTHFGRLIRNNDFTFKTRCRRPPLIQSMPCSALAMPYCYTTYKEPSTLSALILIWAISTPSAMVARLWHWILMEEFRPLVVDAMVLGGAQP